MEYLKKFIIYFKYKGKVKIIQKLLKVKIIIINLYTIN